VHLINKSFLRLSLLLSLSSLCVASIIGYVSQDYEKVSEKFTHVFVLKIESISTSETYTHYKNGTNTLAKNSIYIRGKKYSYPRQNLIRMRIAITLGGHTIFMKNY